MGKLYMVITAIGFDRSGLVDDLSDYLERRNLNIDSSRMAALAGEFAMLALVSGEEADVRSILDNPAELSRSSGLTVFARETDAPGQKAVPASVPYEVVASGMDHPGIVHHIAKLLHDNGVNIEEMDTSVEPAPVSGAPIFTLTASVSIPATVKIRSLRARLEELGDELNVDVECEPEK